MLGVTAEETKMELTVVAEEDMTVVAGVEDLEMAEAMVAVEEMEGEIETNSTHYD